MRIWSLHPKYLDARGLVAVWREGLLAQAVLAGRTKGYLHHPQLVRFRAHASPLGVIAEYLRAVRDEAAERDYRFVAARIGRARAHGRLTVTRGQLEFEWRHLLRKLRVRDRARRATLAGLDTPRPHPLFRVVRGPVEAWEKGAKRFVVLLALLPALVAAPANAAPDEDKLGKAYGYPVGTGASWYYDASVRVGSFTHQAEIKGLYQGRPNSLKASARPMPLPRAPQEPDIRWDAKDARGLTLDDYLGRQRIMGLIVVKDGVIQLERYQYDRKPTDHFTSQSMAKSITALAVGIAQHEGLVKSLDDPAERYAPGLKGSVLGGTTIRNLLRMASGMRYDQSYDGSGDTARFSKAISNEGCEAALRTIADRDVDQGTRFYYSSPHTIALATVLRGATRKSLSEYLTPRLWQAMGAEDGATWYADRTGLEVAFGNFNARLRDYARLGVVLANDGVRPDDPGAAPIVPREFLLDATDWRRVPEPFRPRRATSFMGYGYQFWIFPGEQRRFAMVGVYGQSIYVDPELKLVMVQTGANATAEAGRTSLGSDRDAFWRGVVRFYGKS